MPLVVLPAAFAFSHRLFHSAVYRQAAVSSRTALDPDGHRLLVWSGFPR